MSHFENLCLWFRHRFLYGRIDSDLEVLVVSLGGCGTTSLLNHISSFRHINSIHDTDGFKHIRNIVPNSSIRILFVISDERSSFHSLKRRNYHIYNSLKLGMIYYYFRIPFLFVLEAISIQKKWLSIERNFPGQVLCIHYEKLFESASIIAEFLDLPPSFVITFPVRKSRLS